MVRSQYIYMVQNPVRKLKLLSKMISLFENWPTYLVDYLGLVREKYFIYNVKNLFRKTVFGIYIMKDKYISTAIKQFIKFIAPKLLDRLPPYNFR